VAVTGEGQQLGLQVRGDDRQVVAVGGDGDLQRAAAHVLQGRRRARRGDRWVADLDGPKPCWELVDMHQVAQGQAAEERHPDAAMVRVGGDLPVRKLVGQPLLQRRQQLRRADLLQGQHVGLVGVDHLGQGSQLGVHRGLGWWAGFAADRQQVLHIPSHQPKRHHQPPPPSSAGRHPAAHAPGSLRVST
jgi:hypothetical protein